MSVPHDPAHKAALAYLWSDERYYLVDDPEPTVVINSSTLYKRDVHPSRDAAESAYWALIVETILSTPDRVASASWPGVEIALIRDKASRNVHVAEHSPGLCRAETWGNIPLGLLAWRKRVRELIDEREAVA